MKADTGCGTIKRILPLLHTKTDTQMLVAKCKTYKCGFIPEGSTAAAIRRTTSRALALAQICTLQQTKSEKYLTFIYSVYKVKDGFLS